ncbi:MAG: hypothetical protein QF554_14505, partial [Dehalococcoidia bacterium]|nr:hypothetical protein [Dehalococcoidia bacterium]
MRFSGVTGNRTSWAVILAGLVSLVALACASEGGEPEDTSTPQPSPMATFLASTPASSAGETPEPTATSEPTATPTATSATPDPDEPDVTLDAKAAELAGIGDAVSEIRELSAGGEPNVSLVGKERIAEELAEDLEDPEVLEEIADLEVLFKLLGLIPEDASLLEIERKLLEGAVVGLYNHETGELLVLGGGDDVSVKEEAVYSHEYAHLLQDVNFDLSELFESAEDDSERTSALQALVEGEATFVEAVYASQRFVPEDLDELLAVDPADLAALQATPDFLLLAFGWPYTAGFGFANSIWQDGGMPALDAVWMDLPETTEQIIHPEKYRADEYPEAPPSLPALADVLDEGWSVRTEDVLGEAFLSIWLEALGAEAAVAAQAAAGWGRDGFLLLDGPANESGLGLLIEWDEPGTDALQFSAAFEGVLD